MKRVVIKQVGVSEVEYIREFVVEVPDDCPEELIECVRLEDLKLDRETNWVTREEFHITPIRHFVSHAAEPNSVLPVVDLAEELERVRCCNHEFETYLDGCWLMVGCEHCGLQSAVDDPSASELGEAVIGPYVWEDLSRVTIVTTLSGSHDAESRSTVGDSDEQARSEGAANANG